MHLKIRITALYMMIFGFTFCSCQKENNHQNPLDGFTLKSIAIKQDSLLPAEYTCDGNSSTLPLEWTGFPENTKSFALIMHHEVSPTDIHWYWVLYNIPSAITSLAKDETGIGIPGTNSVNDSTGYAPPCSQGPGPKKYTYTVYALSDSVTLSVEPSEVNRAVLLDAIKHITLASATLTVVYSRKFQQ